MILWSKITAKQGLDDQLAAHAHTRTRTHLLVFVSVCHPCGPPCHPSTDVSDPSRLLVSGVQAELEELVKKEHARIDSQDKSSQSKGAAAEQSAASAAAVPKKEE